MKRSLLMLFLSFCFAASASAGNCKGRIINPITDVCWSCVFPIKLGGVTLSSGKNADPETDANRLCLCASGANITVGLNMSFWEPLRTAEVVRTPYCFPSLGGMELNVGIRAPAHGRTPNPPFIRCIGPSHRGFLSLKFSSTLNVWNSLHGT